MDTYPANYPNDPVKIKSFFFRFLSPQKRLYSLTVCAGRSYDDKNVYPVFSEGGKVVKNRFLVFTSQDYCYHVKRNRGVIVRQDGNWFSGTFNANKKPISGILCRNGYLTFYFLRIPLFNTGALIRCFLSYAAIFAVIYFVLPQLNVFKGNNIFARLGMLRHKAPKVVTVDYSKLDPDDPVEQWRPKKDLPGILGVFMQEAVDKYVQGKELAAKGKHDEAGNLFIESSSKGFVPADYRLGMYSLKGSPDRKIHANGENAKLFFALAAAKGHIPSQFRLAKCFLQGIGTQKSMKLAKYWGYKSAVAGFVPAQRLLGIMLLEGDQKSKQQAVQWLLCAAYQGDREAQYQLSQCYLTGNGVPAERRKSLYWRRLSQKNGNKKALQKVNKTKNRRR